MKPYYNVRKIDDLRQMMRSSSEIFGDRTAYLWKNGTPDYQSYSFKRFRNDVEAFGTYLWSKGYNGKRIIVTGENCYPWAVTYMAVICGLGVIVPVDREINPEEIANIAKVSESALIVHAKSVEPKLSDIDLPKLCFDDIFTCIQEGQQLLQAGNTAYLNTAIDRDALASLIFTSGTTGVSKGVMLSHRNICFNLMEMCQMIYIGPEDTFLSVLPLHHVYECTCGFLCQYYRGSTVAYCEGLRYITKNMQEAKVTMMLAVPVLLESMYKKIWASAKKSGKDGVLKKAILLNNGLKKVGIDLSRKLFKDVHSNFGGKLRLVISGGAKIDGEVMAGLRDLGILAVQGYGLSECAPIAAVNRDVSYCDAAAGRQMPNSKLDIVNVSEDGTGEIRFKGENVMLGYYNAPELTAEVVRDGWFYTGDIGYINKDGFLIITGRKKNVIVTYNGKNIFPEELETYLGRNELVKESAVVGIMNERKKDYDVVAIVVPEMDKIREVYGADVTHDKVCELMKEAVAAVNGQVQAYKHMDYTIVRDEELPKNTSKKIKRYGLVELILDEYRKML